MRVKNWKSFYKKEYIWDTIGQWCGIGFLWYAVYSMMQEVFPGFVEASFVETFGKTEVLLWLSLLWLGSNHSLNLNMNMNLNGKNNSKKWKLLCVPAGIVILIGYGCIHAKELFTGAVGMLKIYLDEWNAYYGTAVFIAAGDPAYASMALCFMAMLVWGLIWLLSGLLKQKALLGLFPVVFLSLELLVGLSPKGSALLCIFFGVMCLVHLGGTESRRKLFIAAALAGCVLVSKFAFADSMEELGSAGKKQEVLQWQDAFLETNFKDIFSKNILFQNMLSIDYHFPMEPLGNQTPVYQGELLLEIKTDKRPSYNMYFKGFHGTTYKNSIWSTDDHAFETVCRENSYSQKELAEYLFEMPYEALSRYHSEHGDDSVEQKYEIHYMGSSGDVAYVPYFSKWDLLKEDVVLKGDYLLKKAVGTKDLLVNVLQDIKAVDIPIVMDEVYEMYAIEADDAKRKILNQLALAYCKNEVQFAFLEDAAEALLEEDTADGINSKRLYYADKVKNYLSERMSYSLILDELPKGADPVEYAVTQGREGYCMHFASAAVMILRELGVPSRYVSGYVVVPSDFEISVQGYKAEVTDYAAHAWVEIYLDNIGWIPYEMTPGYTNTSNVPTKEDADWYEEQSEERKEMLEQNELGQEGAEETQTPEDFDSEENDGDDSGHTGDGTEDGIENGIEDGIEDAVTEESSSTDVNADGEDSKNNESAITDTNNQDGTHMGNADMPDKNREKWQKGIAALVFVLLLIAGGYFGLRKWFLYCENILQKEVNRNFTRRAVKHINHRIYGLLRWRFRWEFGQKFRCKSGLQKGFWTDAQMEEKLIEYYDCVEKEDWKRYMDTKKQVLGITAYNGGIAIKEKDVKTFLLDNYKIRILVYNKLYVNEAGESKTFIPDGVVTAVAGNVNMLGTVWYGTTPEERSGDLEKGTLSIVNTGVSIYTYTTEHPVNTHCVVSEIVLPSYENMDSVFVMKVA